MDMPQTVAWSLAGHVPVVAQLVLLDFTSGPLRLWCGHGPLLAGGHEWLGAGELVSISDLEMPLGGTAPEVTIGLSGVAPEMVARALSAESEYKRRIAQIFVQHFDNAGRPLDGPMCLYTGLMDLMRITAPDVRTRRVEVTLEWLFVRRTTPPFASLSDLDQRALHPGDRICEQVSTLQFKRVAWPSL